VIFTSVRPLDGHPNILYGVSRVQAYGLVKSGRLWQLTVEEWLSDTGFTRVDSFEQLFALRSSIGWIILLLAKVVDDLLLAGTVAAMQDFPENLCKRFKVGRFICDEQFVFNALHIVQDSDRHTVAADMLAYNSKLTRIDISSGRREEPNSLATAEERFQCYGARYVGALFTGTI
jgi:Reverse transcriptase (RNA-dependent DNA polymerase)